MAMLPQADPAAHGVIDHHGARRPAVRSSAMPTEDHAEPESRAVARIELRIVPPQPFRLDLTALALVRRPNNQIDTWRGGTFRRWLPAADPGAAHTPGQFLLEVSGGPTPMQGESGRFTKELKVVATGRFQEQPLEELARTAVTHLFGLDVDLAPFHALAAQDALLAPLATRYMGLRPPRYPGLFQALLNAVPCQQVTLVLGLRLLQAVAREFGPRHDFAPPEFLDAGPLPLPGAAALAGAAPERLKELGLSGAKARTLLELSSECAEGRLDLQALAHAENEVVSERLQRLFGIGRWTADYVLLRGLGRLDVFPYGDSGARNGLARFVGEAGKPSYEWVESTVAPWQPYAGFAYLHLLVAGMLRSGAWSAL